jgi:hypothetical protein
LSHLICSALDLQRSGTAGALVAVVAYLKSFPALLGGYLLLRRQWRAGLVACMTGVALLGATLLVLGWEPHWTYLTGVIPTQRFWFGNMSNVSITGFFTRLLIPNPFTIPVLSAETLGQGLIVATSVALLAGTGYGVWRAARDHAGDMLTYALAVVAMLLVAPINGVQNLIIAMVPLAVAAARIPAADARYQRWLMAAIVLLILPIELTDLLRSSWPFWRIGWGILLASGPLFGLLVLWILLLRLCLESGVPTHPAQHLVCRRHSAAKGDHDG